jgi:hypothetical protein
MVPGTSAGALRALSALGGINRGAVPQAARVPTITAIHPQARSRFMTLLLLEALGAGLILIGIIWWTMFSGRKNGELREADPQADTSIASAAEVQEENTR